MFLLAVALIAGEAYALLLTAERTLAHREELQAPLQEHAEARRKAEQRLMRAQTELEAAATGTPRLKRAIAAKSAADAAVVEKAAEKGCAVHCRALLEQQVATASTEVAAARDEMARLQRAAEQEVTYARSALVAMPKVGSGSPLADRLGVAGWEIDLTAAALASIAANGLAAVLIAFAAHGHGHSQRRSNQPKIYDARLHRPLRQLSRGTLPWGSRPDSLG